jgi:ATP-dependent DNA helicase RecG
VRADLGPVLLYAGQHGNITNTVVQQQLDVSKPTATRYLSELGKGGYQQKTGPHGAGTEYWLIGLLRASTLSKFFEYALRRHFF